MQEDRELDTPSRRLAYFVQDRFDKAANARSSLGIESVWADARTAFEGDFRKESGTDGERDRSQIYVQVTRSKCIAALASIVSAIFQKGEMPYEVEESDIRDSINEYLEAIGISMADNLDAMKIRLKDQIKEAELVQKLTRAIMQMIVYGTVCIHVPVTKARTRTRYDVEFPNGPYRVPSLEEIQAADPELQQVMIAQAQQLINDAGNFVMQKYEEFGPDMEVMRIWDAFPDPDMRSCDVQEGDWFIHRAMITKSEFLDRMRQGMYDEDEARKCIEEEESTDSEVAKGNDPNFDYANSDANFRILTYAGKASLEDLRTVLDPDSQTRVEKRGDDEVVEAVIVTCGARVLSAAIGLDADGMRPFQLCPYEQVPDTPWGRGIPQNIADSQSLVNGLTRSLVETKKLASSLQTVVNPAHLAPGENGKVYPRKVWKLGKHVDDARKAINWFSMPDTSGGTLEAIAVFRAMADDHSGLPRILEGQSAGSSAARTTATEVSQLVSSANLQLENVIRNIDNFLISKIVLGFYRWNMAMSDDMQIKGDFTIYATGYQSFKDTVERAGKIDMVLGGYAQDRTLRRMLKMEDMFRQRLTLDGLEEFMWDSETIQQIIQQDAEAEQRAKEEAMQLQLQIEDQKFQNLVNKKSEVQATKEDIKKQRDQEDALRDIENIEMIEGLKAQVESGQASDEAKKVQETLDNIKAASARVKEKSKESS